MELDHALALANIALTFGKVERATHHQDGAPETDTTHSIMLALVVAEIAQEEGLDAGLAVQFAAVHDLPETYAGDTNTVRGLSAAEADAKRMREAESLARIVSDVGENSWAVTMLRRYERQEENEARLVRYVDKVLPKLTHLLNRGSALRAVGMGADELERKHAAQGGALAQLYPEFDAARHLFHDACKATVAMMRNEG